MSGIQRAAPCAAASFLISDGAAADIKTTLNSAYCMQMCVCVCVHKINSNNPIILKHTVHLTTDETQSAVTITSDLISFC